MKYTIHTLSIEFWIDEWKAKKWNWSAESVMLKPKFFHSEMSKFQRFRLPLLRASTWIFLCISFEEKTLQYVYITKPPAMFGMQYCWWYLRFHFPEVSLHHTGSSVADTYNFYLVILHLNSLYTVATHLSNSSSSVSQAHTRPTVQLSHHE